MKWWLISDKDVQKIRKALSSYGYSEKTSEMLKKGIYVLDTGLHITDVIPSDFQEEKTK